MWKTVGDLIGSFLGAIPDGLPPVDAGEDELKAFARKRRRYDQMVALGGLLLAGAMAFHISWAGGYLSYEDDNGNTQGLSGFATTAQLAPIGSDVKSLLHLNERKVINDAREKIRNNRRRQCLAGVDGNPTEGYQPAIDEGVDEYFELTNEEFMVPPCSEFVVVQNG